MTKIEKLFTELSINQDTHKILHSQWNLDKTLIEKSLNNINTLFPHYSVHDSSHSEVILSRIASLISDDNLEKLSVTDLWLLLESCYMHDTGMIANAERRKKDFKSEEFQDFVKTSSLKGDELSKFCKALSESKSSLDFSDYDDKYHFLIFVYSEFLRKNHAERAEDSIISPSSTIKTDLPRNYLIPNRLWYLLSEICKVHGKNNEQILELPYQENGIGDDVCHPRFIAAMLRLGDLLDIDSNRFVPSTFSMINSLPIESKAHKGKHDGIKHLLVTPNNLSIKGVYTDIEAYLQAEKWFNLLRDEIEFSTLKWDKIDPKPSIGRLPSIDLIEAKLEGQIILKEGSRPQFDLDREKILDLVKGSNIYEGAYDALRELIQNSIDATLLRLSYEKQRSNSEFPHNTFELREELKKFPINVLLTKQENKADKVIWEIKITDEGIGLSLEDIQFLLKLGSSRRNKKRKKLNDWLPNWAKPSGSFGIGFHSIFSYSKNVTLITRHPESSQVYELNFDINEANSEARVIVKQNISEYLPLPGTELIFNIEIDKLPKSIKFGLFDDRNVIFNYDFIKDDEIEYIPMKMISVAQRLAEMSLCSFSINNSITKSLSSEEKNSNAPIYFDKSEGIEITFLAANLGESRTDVTFKGANAQSNFTIPILTLSVNILAGDAKDYLELNRNKLTLNGNKKINSTIYKSIKNNIDEWMSDKKYDFIKGFLSLYKKVYLNDETSDEWMDIKFKVNRSEISLGEIIKYDKIEFTLGIFDEKKYKPKLTKEGNKLTIEYFFKSQYQQDQIIKIIDHHFNRKLITSKGEELFYSFETSEEKSLVIEPSALPILIYKKSLTNFLGSRFTIPCADRYKVLEMPSDYKSWGLSSKDFGLPHMPSPVTRNNKIYDLENISYYIDWLSHKTEKNKSDIKAGLIDFIETLSDSENLGVLDIKKEKLEDVLQEIRRL